MIVKVFCIVVLCKSMHEIVYYNPQIASFGKVAEQFSTSPKYFGRIQ